jgi:hypothetical protein
MSYTLEKLSLFVCAAYDQIMLPILVKEIDFTNPLIIHVFSEIKLVFTPYPSKARPFWVI